MDGVSSLLIILFVICLLLAVFFCSAETAFIGTQKLRLQHLAESGHPRAKIVARIIATPEKFLAFVLLGINFFESAMAAIGTVIAVSLWGENLGAALATVFLTVITLIFVEFIPKSLAARRGEKLALLYARPIDILMKLLYPIIFILDRIGLRFSGLFGEVEPRPTITEEEFQTLISVGHREGTVEPEEAEMLHNVFKLGSRLVREVMIPRPEVVFVEKGITLADFLSLYKEHPQSHFPVFEENRDRIVGILSVKDILLAQAEGSYDSGAAIDSIIKPPYFTPETKLVGDLLVEMRNLNRHLCIVVDEYGGTAGIATLEQLVSEIAGPVGEELTAREKEYEMLDETTFQIDGGMHLGEANEEMGLGLPEGDYDTVAGFILHLLGQIPKQGDHLKYKDMKIVITKVTGARIDEVLVTKKKTDKESVLGTEPDY
jgi:putative hemolysin